MKKNYLFLIVVTVIIAFSFTACSSDNEDDPTKPTIEETITVQNKLKNQFFKIDNVAFQFINDKDVHVWTDIVNNGESYKYTKSTYTIYQDKDYISVNDISTIIYYQITSNNIQYYADQKHNNEITTEEKPNIYEEKDKNSTDPTIEETTLVQNKLKNQFFKIDNVAFQFINDKEVHVWTNIVDNGISYNYQKTTYTVYSEKDYIGVKGISTIIHYLFTSDNIQYFIDQNHKDEIRAENKPSNYNFEDKKPINPIDPNDPRNIIYPSDKLPYLELNGLENRIYYNGEIKKIPFGDVHFHPNSNRPSYSVLDCRDLEISIPQVGKLSLLFSHRGKYVDGYYSDGKWIVSARYEALYEAYQDGITDIPYSYKNIDALDLCISECFYRGKAANSTVKVRIIGENREQGYVVLRIDVCNFNYKTEAFQYVKGDIRVYLYG